jgi:hypothetical protein
MCTRFYRSSLLMLAGASVLLLPGAYAKNKKPKAPPLPAQDTIAVVGHVAVTTGPVTRFLTTQHYNSSYYLYVERDGGKNVTLVDVTKASQPSVLADMSYSSAGESNSGIVVVAGTAALVSTESAPAPRAPQTLRIMDFSDPQNPKVAREFAGVTAMSRDDRRGLIFIANVDGIWIMQQQLAQDPAVEKAYADYVLYSH